MPRKSINAMKPVSYTHLDVYKRQLLHHAVSHLHIEVAGDLGGQCGVGVPGKQKQTVVSHRAYRLWGGHVLPVI